MTIAFVCPDSFKDYEAMEKELLKNKDIEKIICATSNAKRLLDVFSFKHGIPNSKEMRDSNSKRMRRVVDDADKVVLFEYSDYDPAKTRYSRTQISLEHAKKTSKELQYIDYKRYENAKYTEKDELLREIEKYNTMCVENHTRIYKHPLAQALPVLRDDKEIALLAVSKYGFALDFVSKSLLEDKQTVESAVKTYKAIYKNYFNKEKLSDILNRMFQYEYKMNATYMFEGNNGFHHSESRWNAIAQLAFEWMGKVENALKLNIYESSYPNKTSKKWLSAKDEHLDFSGMNSKNTIVEGGLTRTVFGLNESQWSKDFSNIKPDIVHIGEERIVIIEIKTIGASVKENMTLYKRLVDCLEKHTRKDVSLYYLLSYGHRPNSDWTHLKDSNILLWEELFCKIKDSELAPYIHPELGRYTLMPDWLP